MNCCYQPLFYHGGAHIKHVYDCVQNSSGLALSGVSVTVRVANASPGTGALATLYIDNGVTPTTNPVLTDSVGTFSFYVTNGRFDVTYSGTGMVTKTVADLQFDDSTAAGNLTVSTKSANFAASVGFLYLVTTGASTITATLATAVGVSGQVLQIKKVDSGAGTVQIAGTIDGVSGSVISNKEQYVELTSNGTDWEITGNN